MAGEMSNEDNFWTYVPFVVADCFEDRTGVSGSKAYE